MRQSAVRPPREAAKPPRRPLTAPTSPSAPYSMSSSLWFGIAPLTMAENRSGRNSSALVGAAKLGKGGENEFVRKKEMVIGHRLGRASVVVCQGKKLGERAQLVGCELNY